MPIIKKHNLKARGTLYLEASEAAPPRGKPAEPLPRSAQELAHQTVVRAEQEAEDILRRAGEAAEAVRKEAESEGLGLGREEASREAGAKLTEALQTLNEAIRERKKIIRDSEAELLRLSLKIAEQIIRSEVSLHRDVCLNIVSEAINRVSDREHVIVRVNREDLEQVKKYKDRIAGIVDGVKSLAIQEDAAVEAGGAIIETNLGYVDARISTKIKAIDEAFSKVKGSGEAEE